MLRLLAAASMVALPSTALAQIRVAVLYFDNNTADRDFDLLKKGMADMLITDLAGVEGLEVVERERLEALVAELELQRSKYFDPKTALRLGQGMGATHAVTGAFNAVGKRLRIDVRMIEVGTGKVVTTDKVLGTKDQFFDLQQELTASFACALAPATCRDEEENESEAEAPLPAILRYAKALDLADGGHLDRAKQEMQQVMADAPSFPVAKARYLEIVKRIYAARTVRKSELSGNEARLVAKIDEVLRGQAPLPRAIGYRILRGQISLFRIDALFKRLAQEKATPQPADLSRFRELVEAYRDNQLALLKTIDPMSDPPDPEIDEADAATGRELGLGDEPGHLDFYDALQVRRDLASFLTTGREPFWGTFRWSRELASFHRLRVDSGVRIAGKIEYREVPRPPMKLLGPDFAAAGLKLFGAVLAQAEKKRDPKAIIDTLDAHAQALVQLGRLEEAIARWQTILDRFPKHEDYQEIEDRIRAALAGAP